MISSFFFLLQSMWGMCLVSQSLSQSAQSWVGWACRKEEERSCMGDCLKLVCCPHPTDHWDSSILPRSVLRPNHTFCQVLTVWRLRRAWVGFLMSSWGDWSQIPLFPVFYDNVNVINALTCSDWRVAAFLWWTTQKKQFSPFPILLSLCSIDQAPWRAFLAGTVTPCSPVGSGGNWGEEAKACSIGISLRVRVLVECPLAPWLLVFIFWVHTPQSFSMLLRIYFSLPLCHF